MRNQVKYHSHLHAFKLHDLDSMTSPLHGSPPAAGGGCIHDRVLVCKPVPHVTEHKPHADQSVRPPFTTN